MKQLFAILFALTILLVLPGSAFAQKQKKQKNKTKASTTISTKTVRGVESPQELGQYVFDALQNNNFESITQYFPTETDLVATGKTTPDEDLKLILEEQTPEDIVASFKTDFEQLQSSSLDEKINLRDLKLMESQPGSVMKANRVMPVNLRLSDANNQTITLVFETIKIRGRYFLFQHIGFAK